jgi:hypothetical protein
VFVASPNSLFSRYLRSREAGIAIRLSHERPALNAAISDPVRLITKLGAPFGPEAEKLHQNPTNNTSDDHERPISEVTHKVAPDSESLNNHALDEVSLPSRSCEGYGDSCLKTENVLIRYPFTISMVALLIRWTIHVNQLDAGNYAQLNGRTELPTNIDIRHSQTINLHSDNDNDDDNYDIATILFMQNIYFDMCHNNSIAFAGNNVPARIVGISRRARTTYCRRCRCWVQRISVLHELGPKLRSNINSR